MAFQQTTASDVGDLVAVIAAFAEAQGWIKVYDDLAAAGQVGLSKGNCHLALGRMRNSDNTGNQFYTPSDKLNGGTVEDHIMVGALSSGLDSNNKKYWNHPGSLHTDNDITSVYDTTSMSVNDLKGPFSNVWLYSNATGDYVHCVVQCTADRYAHLSFGNVDKKGMTHPDVGYVVGEYFEWWPGDNSVTGTSYVANRIDSTVHEFGLFGNSSNCNLRIEPGTLDVAAGYSSSGGLTTTRVRILMAPASNFGAHTVYSAGGILDYFNTVENQLTTGGVPLHALPVFYYQTLNADLTFLGEFPDVRLVNIANLNPAQEIKFGSEVWQVFPLKRKTTHDDTWYGTTPQPEASTLDYGLAYKKVT